jgi:hypothetical protein
MKSINKLVCFHLLARGRGWTLLPHSPNFAALDLDRLICKREREGI